MEERSGTYWVFVGKIEGRENLKNLGLDGKIILKRISRSGMGTYTGSIWFRIGPDGRLL